jgi:hypothetical protein
MGVMTLLTMSIEVLAVAVVAGKSRVSCRVGKSVSALAQPLLFPALYKISSTLGCTSDIGTMLDVHLSLS